MKKFLIIAFACVLALPLFGCSGQTSDGFNEDKENYEELLEIVRQEEIEFEEKDEIVFTAEKPMNEVVLLDYKEDFSLNQSISYLSGSEIYEDFYDLYTTNIKDKVDCSFYFVSDISEKCPPYLPYKVAEFNAQNFEKGKYVKPYIFEAITLDEEKFSYLEPPEEIPITGIGGTISFRFYFYPIKINEVNSKFRLEFGERNETNANNKSDRWNKYYINIFRGETCIGTCYYRMMCEPAKEALTYKWVADFLKRDLRLL